MKLIFISLFFLTLSPAYPQEKVSRALQWLKDQIVPNDTVPTDRCQRPGLVLSYEIPEDTPGRKYLYGRSNIYDVALTLIVMGNHKEQEAAQKIISGIDKILQADKLYFNYNTQNNWPQKKDQHGALVRTGAMAWLGYALTYYYNLPQIIDHPPHSIELKATLKDLILKTANLIKKFQEKDPQSPLYSLLKGGQGNYTLVKEEGHIKENYSDTEIPWTSVEHNIDAFFFFREAATIVPDPSFKTIHQALEKELVEKFWNPNLKQFNRGLRSEGPDTVEALDAASWGSMFLKAIGDDIKAGAAYNKTHSYLTKQKDLLGHKPYINNFVYDDPKTNKLFYPKDPSKNFNDLRIIWPEGTFGVALAALKLNKEDEALNYLKAMEKLQKENGSLPYSNLPLAFQFNTHPSVASTAWFVLVHQCFNNKAIKDYFWGEARLFNDK